jgi:glycosyltransferase involved in cell wall biosynthesis
VAHPLVSVVIPVFNGERFLAQALDSVVGQTWPQVEPIVVDDGSTDGSAEVAAAYPVKLIRQPNAGVAAARNRAVEAAGGPLLAFIDQDDVWLPAKLEQQVACLLDNPSAGLCICRQDIFLEPGYPRPPAMPPEWLERTHHTTQLGCMVIRRELFDVVGPFDTSFAAINDTDWFLRAMDLGVQAALIDDSLQRYRLHGDNTSVHMKGLRSELCHAVHASIERKREAALQ